MGDSGLIPELGDLTTIQEVQAPPSERGVNARERDQDHNVLSVLIHPVIKRVVVPACTCV